MLTFVAVFLVFVVGWLMGASTVAVLLVSARAELTRVIDGWARSVDEASEPTPEGRRSRAL